MTSSGNGELEGFQMSTQQRPQAGGDRDAELAIVRRAYAKHVLANAEDDDARTALELVADPVTGSGASSRGRSD